jgi:hypothetical protein
MKAAMCVLGIFAATLPLSACAANPDVQLPPSGYPAEEEEFFRIESCVLGGLPKEVQFVTDGSPPLIVHHAALDAKAVLAVAASVDPQIAALLREAANHAWEKASKDRGAPDFEELLFDFDQAVVERAPKRLTLTFCGDQEQVGRSIATAITGWFARALQATSDNAAMKRWLDSLGERGVSFGASLLEIAVALKLANIDYSLESLSRGFEEFATDAQGGT